MPGFIYRSNLLGSDQRITNTGGGNTSSKIVGGTIRLSAAVPEKVLWVKAFRRRFAHEHAQLFSSLYLSKLDALQQVYAKRADKGVKSPAEDDMVGFYSHCTFNLNPRASSIDTPYCMPILPGQYMWTTCTRTPSSPSPPRRTARN